MRRLWFLPKLSDRGVVQVVLGGALNSVINFTCGSGGRQSNPDLIRKIERQAEILVHQTQRKTWRVIALEQHGSLNVKNRGARHTRLQHLDKFFAGQARAGYQS